MLEDQLRKISQTKWSMEASCVFPEGYPGRFTWGVHISHAFRSREIRSRTTERLVFTRSNREALMIRNWADIEGKGEVLISLLQCLAYFHAVSQTKPDLDLV